MLPSIIVFILYLFIYVVLHRLSKVVRKRVSAYVFVYLICWAPDVVVHLLPYFTDCNLFILYALTALVNPLQGTASLSLLSPMGSLNTNNLNRIPQLRSVRADQLRIAKENIQKTIGSHLPVISVAGHSVLPLSPDRPMGLEIGRLCLRTGPCST